MSDTKPTTDSKPALTRAAKHLPLTAQCICLIAAVIGLSMALTGDRFIQHIPAMSPFVALASIIARRTLPPMAILGLIVMILALRRHRWFCRWACPTGLCADAAGRLGKCVKAKPSQGAPLGQWILLLTLGGAILGYPLLLWLDPLSIFAAVFLITDITAIDLAWISILPFAILLIVSAARPGLWCRSLCPLGALQDMINALYRRAAAMSASRKKTAPANIRNKMPRRTVFALALGAACAAAARKIRPKSKRPLRPPGAVEEQTFVGLCTRCGNCIRACPYDIIQRAPAAEDWAGLLTPTLNFQNDYCREDCTKCTDVCPSGALVYTPVRRKPELSIGLPKIDMNICLLAEDRECAACMRWCPYGAIRYVFSEETYSLIPIVNAEKCNGCGACQTACPTKPVKAIRIFANAPT